MFYNVSILDFHGRECEVRVYSSPVGNDGFRCDDDGVILDRRSKWQDDDWSPFTDGFDEDEIVDDMVRVHDLDEMEKRAKESARCSLSRTKNKVYQLARGNEWKWFVTFTFGPTKTDRYSWEETSGKLRNYLWYMAKQHTDLGLDLRYIVVPEMHKDGAWHFHGIFGGCKNSILKITTFLPDKGFWLVDSWRWGFSSATEVKDDLSVSNYITKYFTKDMVSVTKCKKRYWASRNLELPDRANFSVSAKDESGIRIPIEHALADMVSHVNVVEGVSGTVTYLQVAGSMEQVIDSLSAANVRIEEAELRGAGS